MGRMEWVEPLRPGRNAIDPSRHWQVLLNIVTFPELQQKRLQRTNATKTQKKKKKTAPDRGKIAKFAKRNKPREARATGLFWDLVKENSKLKWWDGICKQRCQMFHPLMAPEACSHVNWKGRLKNEALWSVTYPPYDSDSFGRHQTLSQQHEG